MFNTLTKELKYGLEDPANLKPKHVEALMQHWQERKLLAATIENYLSILRLFYKWINKGGMFKPLVGYAPDVKRTYAAKNDRSPQFNGTDFWGLWDKINAKDGNVGHQLLLAMAFGARRKELTSFKPLVHDKGLYIELEAGTKGGKVRTVPVDSELKRQVLDHLKEYVGRKHGFAKAHLGNQKKTLQQNLKRYDYVMATCGVTKAERGFTGHSFRQEYMIDQLGKHGIVATVRGGSGRAETNLETEIAYLQVSGQAGHNRIGVMTAYSGPRRKVSDTR